MHFLAVDAMPLLEKVAKWRNMDSSDRDVLFDIYQYLKENKIFKEAYNLMVYHGIETSLKFLENYKQDLVKVCNCQENKRILKQLLKYSSGQTIHHFGSQTMNEGKWDTEGAKDAGQTAGGNAFIVFCGWITMYAFKDQLDTLIDYVIDYVYDCTVH